jgi:hypothetical protein
MKGLLNRLIERGGDSQSSVDFVRPRTPSRFESRIPATSSERAISEEQFGSDESIVTTQSATQKSNDVRDAKPGNASTTDIAKDRSTKPLSADLMGPLIAVQPAHTEPVSGGEPRQAHQDSGFQDRPSSSPNSDTDIKMAVSDWHDEIPDDHQQIRIYESIRNVPQSGEVVTETGNTSANNPAAVISSDLEQGMLDIVDAAVDQQTAEQAVAQPTEVKQSSPQINVRIGRIEVRSTPAPASRPRTVTSTQAGRQSSLTSYLGWKRR